MHGIFVANHLNKILLNYSTNYFCLFWCMCSYSQNLKIHTVQQVNTENTIYLDAFNFIEQYETTSQAFFVIYSYLERKFHNFLYIYVTYLLAVLHLSVD